MNAMYGNPYKDQIGGHFGPNDGFRDTIALEFKDEGIVKTFDKKNKKKEMYYCVHCNNYIKYENVSKHVKLSEHFKRKQNPSYNHGLNKKFVMKSIEKKDSTDQFLIKQELNRIPIDLKHFYCRRGIRLMDAVGPHAYYCKSCKQSISSFNLIEKHLISELHGSVEGRETLITYVNESTDSVPVIGLQYITEYKVPQMIHILYECTVCQSFLNAQQMHRHVTSFGHHLKLLRILDNSYDEKEKLSEVMVEKRIIDLHKRHGSGYINKINELPTNTTNNKQESDCNQLSEEQNSTFAQTYDNIIANQINQIKNINSLRNMKVEKDCYEGYNDRHHDCEPQIQSQTITSQTPNVEFHNREDDSQRELYYYRRRKRTEEEFFSNSNSFESLSQKRTLIDSLLSKSRDIQQNRVAVEGKHSNIPNITELFSVKLFNEYEASKVVSIIESIKDAVVEYYSKKASHQMRSNYENMNIQYRDNYENCEMDTSF